MKTSPQELRTVLVTDCGSTTTKALLFERTDAGWRQTHRGEAPTTVEEPVADVTVGAKNAFLEVQELSGRTILNAERATESPFVETSTNPSDGIDLYLSTSSAGGGLQMLVTGIVRQMSTESAERAALGAGAIVMDSICSDDGRDDAERIERIRHLRPDILLMAGGVDGGSRQHVIEMAELIVAASPRPRFGDTLRLPVVYAGNKDAAAEVTEILSSAAQVRAVANLRPSLDREELEPARDVIHEFFLSHVMSHAPGYGKLLTWSPVPVMPTPAAVGDMVLAHATRTHSQVLCADIGGATTDVFSVFRNTEEEPVFNRTVSANLGMSYSVANVLIEAGAKNIARWLPYEISEAELSDRLRNKMIRPTSIPQSLEDLWLEQAVCREALRLSLAHHRMLAVGLAGMQQRRGIAEMFAQKSNRYELVDLMRLDLVIGSGGVLSHAPERLSAALMMLDGFGLQGVTELAVDSIFMMPHLGVLASVHPAAAQEIFTHDCLVHIAYGIAPVYDSRRKNSPELCAVALD
ncbi:MAG: methylaspartate mutase, partial [Proteobacteria bacterium]|nr:methylaspartate mutase [Pseudomonadota bacterium]